MQKCSICDKPIYGRAVPTKGTIVCGSCPLNKAPGGASGKSYSEVRMDMAKLITNQVPTRQESLMSDLKVKSNVGGRTILLDGRHPVKFDAKGIGRCPAHLRELLEREMIMKPGRFSIIEEAPEVAPVVEAPMAEVPEVAEEVVVLTVEEVPADIDQSFLAAEETVKPVKASKKK